MTTPDFTPDSAPLADALRKIALLSDRSESDPQVMTDMLHQIAEYVREGREGYMAEVRKAQDAEIAYLRANA